ncbi:MAG: hypothetical protein GX977_04455 [Firmicutes bacterium]|nr:hypothetical protein [Bacillota bacterium]
MHSGLLLTEPGSQFAIPVLSPRPYSTIFLCSQARASVHLTLVIYARAGIPHYWIVDPEKDTGSLCPLRYRPVHRAELCRGDTSLHPPELPGANHSPWQVVEAW